MATLNIQIHNLELDEFVAVASAFLHTCPDSYGRPKAVAQAGGTFLCATITIGEQRISLFTESSFGSVAEGEDYLALVGLAVEVSA